MPIESAAGPRMEWSKLLKLERLNDPGYPQDKHRSAPSQDVDRILFSPSFRRLTNKTQVHPLYDNDHLHNRMIHSLEVATVGRSLGIEIGAWLADERGEISAQDVDALAGLVQTACMAHDIGNPPFGHSGEAAIGAWFSELFSRNIGIAAEIPLDRQCEFEDFEGNAQGFRILTRTEMYKNEGGFRLTMGGLGAFAKYPVSAWVGKHLKKADPQNVYIGAKKYGFFDNDAATFHQIADELGLPSEDAEDASGCVVGRRRGRHPLAFLMEAADDICYNIMDLEDAYLAKNIGFDQVIGLLENIRKKSNKEYKHQSQADTVSRYRATAITGAIRSCAEAFKENYDEIMTGRFNRPLVEASDKAAEFKAVKTFAKEMIFTQSRKTELEVYGRNLICRIMDGLLPLLEQYEASGRDLDKLSPYHAQLVRALDFPVHSLGEPYESLHALADFTSGMTDRYAVKVAELLGR